MSLFTIGGILPSFIIVMVALASAHLMVRDNTDSSNHHFASIDGLRGFLALFVFLHHSSYWFNFSHHHSWSNGGSSLSEHFGQTSVCLFFMVSGFLFTHKLLEGRTREVNWLRLYCSRFLRLTPLYFASVGVILILIAIESNFNVYENSAALTSNILRWLLFTAPGHPDINGHPDTHLMLAGVVWTLPYEWYFYFCLPLLGVLLGTKSTPNTGIWLLLSGACLLTFNHWNLEMTWISGFLGGGVAAAIVRTEWLRHINAGKGLDFIVLAALIIAYTAFDRGTFYTRLLILTLAFSCIASGTSLFGLLHSRAARALSNISYGIYLLHGLVLYIVYMHLLDTQTRTALSDVQHSWLVIVCTPILIGVSALSWHFIEQPAIRFTSTLTKLLTDLHQASKPTACGDNHSDIATKKSSPSNVSVVDGDRKHD